MAAIQPSMLEALKRILSERYVPHLPPLLGNGANQQDKKNKQVSRAFSAFVLQSKFGLDAKTAAEQVTDDFNDNGIDAVYYHEADKTLYLLQSKLKANEQFSQEEAQDFASGIGLLLNSQLDNFNNNFQNRRHSIENALDQCNYIKLVVAYVGDSVSLHAQTVLLRVITNEREEDDRLCEAVEYFDAQSVAESLRLEQALEPIKIERLKIHKFRELDAPRKTVFGLVSIVDLIVLHNKHDKALYEKNIRFFIGSGKRGVNSAIKKTLLNEPDSFFHLNNGITFICASIKGKRKSKSDDRKIEKNFELLSASVVNGAQTIASAAQFVVEHPEADISAAKVMVTIIQANETGDFHKQVTRARNLQNPVELSHFTALDDVQEHLRREIAIHGYEYHYRPYVQVSGRTGQHILPSITIDELAKALACFSNDVRFPAYLKSEPSQFTTAGHESYKAIFNDRLTGAAAINAVLVFRWWITTIFVTTNTPT
ncbi:MAG: AIPR family protein [Thiothrix sp.]|uniref:AIPR family protein n=1 Tax=Thiothrix sp. TaxID=1032 RepID=UPI00262BF1D3|nr:AIPR family protein [Thiothrix sp.]MDD5392849.1 AIPR family protein [Thiothrix sp.]